LKPRHHGGLEVFGVVRSGIARSIAQLKLNENEREGDTMTYRTDDSREFIMLKLKKSFP
jgi:hypothetical protein